MTDYVFWFRQVISIDQKLTEDPSNMVGVANGGMSVTLTNPDVLLFVNMNIEYFLERRVNVKVEVLLSNGFYRNVPL